jgi:hypothetical protein
VQVREYLIVQLQDGKKKLVFRVMNCLNDKSVVYGLV